MNNVAHDTFEHCYFLEDGGEKETVFEGNLGLTTRPGFLTPSDNQVSINLFIGKNLLSFTVWG